jgi:Ca-activated chloride channel family protein
MSFASPELLLGLLLVPLALAGYLWVQRRRTRYAVRFTNVELLSNLAPRTPRWRRHVPPVFYLFAIGALVLALARPSMVVAVPREEATVVLVMDVSGSMLATDVAPSRLAAAQQAATDFVAQLPAQFRVALVAFSTGPRVVVAPTTDRAAIADGLANLRARGGTALGDAIEAALETAGLDPAGTVGSGTPDPSASPDPSAAPSVTPDPSGDPAASDDPDGATDPDAEPPLVATVLLSDGAQSTGEREPLDAAADAAALNVPVYTIALGTDEGVVTVEDEFGQPQTLDVPPDRETLAAIAELTNARSFEAPTAEDLRAIYDNLGSRVGFTEEEQEVSQAFAAAGLLFVLGGAALAAHWFNRFP